MGIYSDFLAIANVFDKDSPRVGISRVVFQHLKALLDKGEVDYPSGYDERNEIQSIPAFQGTVTGGTYILNFENFKTAPIVYNSSAATIESAIDSAGGFSGDISVSGGPLNSSNITLTFNGPSVQNKRHVLTEINGSMLTGGGSAGEVNVVTYGQTKRPGWAILKVNSVVESEPPPQGDNPSDILVANSVGLSDALLTVLAEQIAVCDNNEFLELEILHALGYIPERVVPLDLSIDSEEEIVIGQVVAFAGTTPPSKWLLCNGASYEVAVHQALFNVIGYTYGGEGPNFNVPDLRGRLALGAGVGMGLSERTLADSGGGETITNVPEHNHECRPACHNAGGSLTLPANAFPAGHAASTDSPYNGTSDNTMGSWNSENTGDPGGVDVMNPFLTLNYIIQRA